MTLYIILAGSTNKAASLVGKSTTSLKAAKKRAEDYHNKHPNKNVMVTSIKRYKVLRRKK